MSNLASASTARAVPPLPQPVSPVAQAKAKRPPNRALQITASFATAFAIGGHALLGFEQSIFQMVVAVLTGYTVAFLLEFVDAWCTGKPVAFKGQGFRGVVMFLLAPHMTSITTSFLIYVNDNIFIMMFAVAAGISSKYLFRITGPTRADHFMNPSNFGIITTFTLFPTMTVIPYQFTETVSGPVDWIVPAVIWTLGTRLNIVHSKRITVIISWLVGFVLQGAVRSTLGDANFLGTLMPMTGVAFALFSCYMVTDPKTSPPTKRGQILFGAGMAAAYGVLITLHVMMPLMFCVTAVCAIRGIALFLNHRKTLALELPKTALAAG
jgi:hypothetical protein